MENLRTARRLTGDSAFFLIAARASRPCRAKGDMFILPPRGRLTEAAGFDRRLLGVRARALVTSLSREAVELEPAAVDEKTLPLA